MGSIGKQPGNFSDSISRQFSGSRPIWLDCDPGHDDALAIILAAYSDSVSLLGISTVHGNQEVHKVTRNALQVLSLCGRQGIDVVQGQARPLLRAPKACPQIHGVSGLDGPEWGDPPGVPLQGKAIHVMFERIHAAYNVLTLEQASSILPWFPEGVPTGRASNLLYSHVEQASANSWKKGYSSAGGKDRASRVAVVCTGTLTNLALLLSIYPEVIPLIEVVIMGGSLGTGNTGPVAEFNMQCDPEAAQLVFQSGALITMVPLESGLPPNVHVARKLDIPAFWDLLLVAIDRADANTNWGKVASTSSSVPSQ